MDTTTPHAELNTHNKQEYPPMHTAEHILNATMVRMFGCERSEKNHIERTKSKCDYRINHQLTAEELKDVEAAVNKVISDNLPVTYSFTTISAETAEKFNLKRLPENASETIRIVSIGNYDSCPCIGNHVTSTGEIPPFRISSSRYADGWQRIVFRLG